MLLFHRYDIKGCEVGRWTDPDTGGKQIIKVLKDNNFEGQSIALGRRSTPIETRLLSLPHWKSSDVLLCVCRGACRWGEILVCQSGAAGQCLPAGAQCAGLQPPAGPSASAPRRAGRKTLSGKPRHPNDKVGRRLLSWSSRPRKFVHLFVQQYIKGCGKSFTHVHNVGFEEILAGFMEDTSYIFYFEAHKCKFTEVTHTYCIYI